MNNKKYSKLAQKEYAFSLLDENLPALQKRMENSTNFKIPPKGGINCFE